MLLTTNKVLSTGTLCAPFFFIDVMLTLESFPEGASMYNTISGERITVTKKLVAGNIGGKKMMLNQVLLGRSQSHHCQKIIC